jgi:hypothetical protein
MSWYRALSGACDQILLLVGRLLSESCSVLSVGRPLWRQNGFEACSAVIKWPESRRTRNHTLLSHLRLPQPGGPDSRIYIPQELGGPLISLDTGLRVTGLRLRYSNPPPHWIYSCRSWSYFTTNGQSVSMSKCRAHSRTWDQILLPVRTLLSESCGILSDERTGLELQSKFLLQVMKLHHTKLQKSSTFMSTSWRQAVTLCEPWVDVTIVGSD